jgi:hypothetical protein
MKAIRIIFAVCFAVVGSVSAVNRWTQVDGEWHSPATWGGATSVAIPKSTDWALVTNTVSVSVTTYEALDRLSVGKSGASGAVTVGAGGALAPATTSAIGDGGTGLLTLDGGSFLSSGTAYAGYSSIGDIVINSGTFTAAENLNVARGYSANYASASGSSLMIQGGTVSVNNLLGMGVNGQANGSITVAGGTLNVANGLILDQGTFTVDGSDSSITLAKNVAAAQLDIRANATVRFLFDSQGISTIGFDEKTLELYDGASIVVDGSLFSGDAGLYTLLDCGAFAATGTNRFSNVSISGFDAYEGAELQYNDLDGTVSLNVIPEPATLGMLGVSAGLLLLIRRRFL